MIEATIMTLADIRPRFAAQYLRMSTDVQLYSLENQAAIIATYAEAHGFEIVGSYEDAGRSGVTTKARDGLKALLRDVMSGDVAFSTILVLDVSRWGRFQDPDEAAHYEFICREAGVKVEYCNEAFENDGSTSAAILKTLKRVMAGEYSRQLATRCRAGSLRQVGRGAHPGGYPPYGLRRQAFNADGTPDRVLEAGERRARVEQMVQLVRGPDEEVRTTRTIFSLFASRDRTTRSIADYLNAKNIPYSRPGPWTPTRIRSVLTNELAIGVRVYNRVRGGVLHPPGIAPPDEWRRLKVLDPIVSMTTFRSAQKKLRDLGRRERTDEEMLARVKRGIARHGDMTWAQMRRAGIRPESYVERFGSLPAAWRLIGHTPGKCVRRYAPEVYERDSIAARMRDLLQAHGHLSVAILQQASGLPSVSYITHTFGSLFEAYRAAGFESSQGEAVKASWDRRKRRGTETGRGARYYNHEQIIGLLRKLLAEHGYLKADLLKGAGLPAPSTLGRQFGSVLTAFRLAGYDVDASGAAKAAWLRRKAREEASRSPLAI